MNKHTSLEYIKPEDIDSTLYFEADTWELFLVATHFSIFPGENEWDDVKYYIRRDKVYSRLGGGEGYLYILECSNQPGICKIGMTERTPNERLKEINGGTGVIVPWMLTAAYPCKAPRAVEKLVHLELQKYRINLHKEGFNITSRMAKETIERVIKSNKAEL